MNRNTLMPGNECKPQRQTYAQTMLDLAGGIAVRAEETASRLHDKLRRVSLDNVPVPENDAALQKTLETYPELWDEFRKNLRRIDAALDYIQNSSDRAEV